MLKQKSPPAAKRIKTVSYFYLFDKAHRTRPQLQADLIKDYGDIVRLHRFLPHYAINHPDIIKHIFITNTQNYIKADKSYQGLTEMIGPGIITNNGNDWRAQRLNLAPLFQPQKFSHYLPAMTALTQQTLARWHHYANTQQPFNLTQEIMSLTLKISARNFLNEDLEDDIIHKVIAFSQSMNHHVGKAHYLFRWLHLPSIRQLKQEQIEIETYLRILIQKRKMQFNPPQDLLTQLLQLRDTNNEPASDDSVLAELKNFLVASYETVAHALTWTWYHLLHHPEALKKSQTEIAQADYTNPLTLPELPFTKMIIEESMRLSPPAWIITRRAIHADEYAGYRIPAGANLLICPYAVHRHPDFWPDPEKFMPERFSEENKAARHRCSYLPFGAGPRTCIASPLALIEAQTILAGLLPHFTFKFDPRKRIQSQAFITFSIKKGLWLTAHNPELIPHC